MTLLGRNLHAVATATATVAALPPPWHSHAAVLWCYAVGSMAQVMERAHRMRDSSCDGCGCMHERRTEERACMGITACSEHSAGAQPAQPSTFRTWSASASPPLQPFDMVTWQAAGARGPTSRR